MVQSHWAESLVMMECAVVMSYICVDSLSLVVGGMGSGYNLPRTPDDFLSNMEEMDIHDGGECHLAQGFAACISMCFF